MQDPNVGRLWSQLEEEERRVTFEKKRLTEIWSKIGEMHRKNAKEREGFEEKAKFSFVPLDTRMVLNVGGQVIETTAKVLTRDRFSLLAALCKTEAPVQKDENGAFFLDRDWWIFRYVLQFLRSGSLPRDVSLLKEMYAEASFYRLRSLRRAIERSMEDDVGDGGCRGGMDSHSLPSPAHMERGWEGGWAGGGGLPLSPPPPTVPRGLGVGLSSSYASSAGYSDGGGDGGSYHSPGSIRRGSSVSHYPRGSRAGGGGGGGGGGRGEGRWRSPGGVAEEGDLRYLYRESGYDGYDGYGAKGRAGGAGFGLGISPMRQSRNGQLRDPFSFT